MAVLPEEIPTGTLTGQFYFVNEDNIDADTNPELTVVRGFVRCVASVKTLRIASKKAVIIPLRFDAQFDSQGNLVPADGTGIGMKMPAVDSTLFDTTGWTWTATFELVEVETGFTVNLAPVTFQIFEGQDTDLSDVIPVAPSPGVITTRGPEGPAGQDGQDGSNVLPTNTAIANAINEEGATKTALSAAIDESLARVPTVPAGNASDRIAAFRDFGSGTIRIAAVGDSSWNDGDEPIRRVCADFGITLPTSIRREYSRFDGTAFVEVVDAQGVGLPPSGGTLISDDFNRVSTPLVGSTSSSGRAWLGSPANAWSSDGATAGASVAGGISIDAGAKDASVSADLLITTQSPAATSNMRVYAGSPIVGLGGDGVYAQIGISTSGSATFSVFSTIGGASTQIGSTVFATGLTSNSATPQSATLEIQVDIQNVTARLTVFGAEPIEITGTITEAAYSALGTHAGAFRNTGGGATTFRVDFAEISVAEVPATGSLFRIINTAVGGATIQYQLDRIAQLFPASAPIDVLMIAHGHNYGAQTPAQFLTAIGGFVDAFRLLHPDTAVMLSSQNPQFAPSPTVAAHAERQRALRAWAIQDGHEYLPAYEAFAVEADGGASLVKTDGIHPTTPLSPYTAHTGSRVWADAILRAINARSRAWPQKQ